MTPADAHRCWNWFADDRDGNADGRIAWFRCGWALSAWAQFAATWRLWIPQDVYPQIPLLGAAAGLPGWCDWLLAGGVAVSLLFALIVRSGRTARRALVVFAACVASSILLDQHRLQPWAYQAAIVAVVLAAAQPGRARGMLRWLVVSIYVYSAVSKLDATFCQTLGPQLLDGLADAVGLALDGISPAARMRLALAFPVGELLVAGLLFWPRTRVAGWAGSVAMHVLLICAAGPLGLDHKPAVLLWNAYFLWQNTLLFGPSAKSKVEDAIPDSQDVQRARASASSWERPAATILAAAVTLPILEPWGWFDAWPSWSVYAPATARATVLIHGGAAARLPEQVTSQLQPQDGSPWRTLDLNRWSLETLDVPVYPQLRFQVAVALAVAERYGLGNQIRVVVSSRAGRLSGKRERRRIDRATGIRSFAQRFWLGTTPRRRPRP